MSNRRQFMRKVLGGTAAVAASHVFPTSRVLGANDRVRFGMIGVGGRGTEDLRAALRATNVEAVAIADLYTRRLDEARTIAPQAKTYGDFRRLLDDKSIDAVVIATPQHQHALQFIDLVGIDKELRKQVRDLYHELFRRVVAMDLRQRAVDVKRTTLRCHLKNS